MKKTIIFIIILPSLFLLSGCGSSNTNTVNMNPQSTNNSPAQNETSAASSMVNIANFSFNPVTLTIKKGAVVTWTNNDSSPHQIKSADFNSDLLNNGQSYSFTFNNIGTFDYSCAIHPSMTGKIIVE
jgi:plastocyanin